MDKPVSQLQHYQTVGQMQHLYQVAQQINLTFKVKKGHIINECLVKVQQNEIKTGQFLYLIMQSSTTNTNAWVVQDPQLSTSPVTASSVKSKYRHLGEIPFDSPLDKNIEILTGADHPNLYLYQSRRIRVESGINYKRLYFGIIRTEILLRITYQKSKNKKVGQKRLCRHKYYVLFYIPSPPI